MCSTSKPILKFSNISLTKRLGNGSYGFVFEAERSDFYTKLSTVSFPCESTKDILKEPEFVRQFAVKIIPGGKLNEIISLSKLRHPNIVSCYNAYADKDADKAIQRLKMDDKFVFVQSSEGDNDEVPVGYKLPNFLILEMEYCNGGTLDHWLQNRKEEEWEGVYHPESIMIFTQLLEALYYLQLKDIVHADIKPNNVLLTRKDSFLVAKLADFGLADSHRTYSISNNLKHDTLSKPSKEQIEKQAVLERVLFQSPEKARINVLKKFQIVEGASHKSDIYSFGLIWLCLLSPKLSLRNIMTLVLDCMKEEEFRVYPEFLVSVELGQEFSLIKDMISHDMTKRPNATAIKEWVDSNETYKNYQHAPFRLEEDKLKELQSKQRCRVENMQKTFDFIHETPDDQLHPAHVSLYNRGFQLAIDILHELTAYPPGCGSAPNDPIVKLAMKNLDRYHHGTPEGNVVDCIYVFKKLVKDVEARGLDYNEDRLVFDIFSSLAITLAANKFSEEGMSLLTELVLSKMYDTMEILDPVRIAMFLTYVHARVGYFYSVENEFQFTSEEMVETLKTAEKLYEAMTKDKSSSPLMHLPTETLFTLIVRMLAKLGRNDEAEQRFADAISESNDSTDPHLLESLLSSYCEFLSHHCERHDEAIWHMEHLLERHKKFGNFSEATNSIAFLIGVSLTKKNQSNNWTEEDEERMSEYWQEHFRLHSQIKKSENLLVNGQELKLINSDDEEDETQLVVSQKSVDFTTTETI